MSESEAKVAGAEHEEAGEEQNEVDEIRAEEESAAAMDADVPQPPDEAQGGEQT